MGGSGMRIEDAIIEAGLKQKIKMSHLYKPATHCKDNPDTGVNGEMDPRAKSVIKDCAIMAECYLPVEVFCRLKNPIASIRGNMNDVELKEFAKDVNEGNKQYARVLYTMIFDYKKPEKSDNKKKPEQIADVYGDYTSLMSRKAPIGRNKTYDFEDVLSVLEGLLL
jgi:hypothetical protein